MRFTVKQSDPAWVKELQKAAIDGAIVQWRSTATNKWSDIGEGRDVKFTLPQSEYRIKPAPVVPIEHWAVKLNGRIYCHASSIDDAKRVARKAGDTYTDRKFEVCKFVEEIVDES